MTTTLLICDIPDDRLRSKGADHCLDCGLELGWRSSFPVAWGQGSCLLAPERVE